MKKSLVLSLVLLFSLSLLNSGTISAKGTKKEDINLTGTLSNVKLPNATIEALGKSYKLDLGSKNYWKKNNVTNESLNGKNATITGYKKKNGIIIVKVLETEGKKYEIIKAPKKANKPKKK